MVAVTALEPRPPSASGDRSRTLLVGVDRSIWAQRRDGIAVAAAGATVGLAVHRAVDLLSPHVVAVLVGVILANTGVVGARHRPGLRFAARSLLRAGIVLVGFRLALGDLAELGPGSLAAVVTVVVATFFGTQWLGRRLGVSPEMSFLVGTGYAICGASAIAAAEPFSNARDEEVAYALALVTLCGTASIAVLPLVGHLFGMDDATFGSWVGAAVHDVGQVVATAGTRDSAAALQAAVVVKLTRVAMLAPLLFGVALAARRRATATRDAGDLAAVTRPPLLPLFVVLFLVAVAVRTTGVVPAEQLGWIKHAETFVIGAGLVGLGAAVDVRSLRRLGGRPLLLGAISWVLVAGTAWLAVAVAIA